MRDAQAAGEGSGGAKGEDVDEDLGGKVFVNVFWVGIRFVLVVIAWPVTRQGFRRRTYLYGGD